MLGIDAAIAQVHSDETLGRIRLETSEPLFAVLATINLCGYDSELNSSNPLRQELRLEAQRAVNASGEAGQALESACRFYRSKQQKDGARDLSQFLSLALNLSPAPFTLITKEADLPPDALDLVPFIPMVQRVYDAAGWQRLWLRSQRAYDERIVAIRKPIDDMIFKTDLYLKMPSSTYLGRKLIVYVEALAAPGQINARNYGDDYYLVIAPSSAPLKMDAVRHTYLHYVLDPLILKRAKQVAKVAPLLEYVATAPMEEIYKRDASLLIIESLIRAIEARTLPVNVKDAKAIEAARSASAQIAVEQGFILTRYFYESLTGFEKEPTGIKDAFADMLYALDVGHERSRAEKVTYAKQAVATEVMASSATARPRRSPLLIAAETRLGKGDGKGARELAEQILKQQREAEERGEVVPAAADDRAQAMFILARAATLNKDVDGAQLLFEQTLQVAKEPRTVAWSHIMLGRILDLRCNRDAALGHYKSALSAGDNATDTKSAAQKGIAAAPTGCKEVAAN